MVNFKWKSRFISLHDLISLPIAYCLLPIAYCLLTIDYCRFKAP